MYNPFKELVVYFLFVKDKKKKANFIWVSLLYTYKVVSDFLVGFYVK